jgi:hypothetical protein
LAGRESRQPGAGASAETRRISQEKAEERLYKVMDAKIVAVEVKTLQMMMMLYKVRVDGFQQLL